MEIHPTAAPLPPLAGHPDLGALTVIEQVPAPDGTVFLKAINPGDGSIYWVAMQRTEADVPPLLGDSCQTVQNLAERMLTALHEKARAEEELRRQERFYKGLLENAFDCVMVKDAEGKVYYVSPGIRSFGLQPEQVLGHNGFELFHPDDLVPMQETFRAIPCGPGQSHRSKHRIRFPDGHVRTLEVVGRNMLHDEAIRGFIINFRDISEQTRIEEELAQKERYFRALFDNSFDVTFTRDAEGRITYISPSVQRVLGYTPDELIGKVAIDALVHPDDAETTREGATSLLDDPDYLVNNQVKMVRKDGKVIITETVAKNLLDDPAVRGYLITFRDVTEQFETEARLAGRERYFRSLVEDARRGVYRRTKTMIFLHQSACSGCWVHAERIQAQRARLVHDYVAGVEETSTTYCRRAGGQGRVFLSAREGHYVFWMIFIVHASISFFFLFITFHSPHIRSSLSHHPPKVFSLNLNY
jgi:PAS domain S-box-containing protein